MKKAGVFGICLSRGGDPTMSPYLNQTILLCKKLGLDVSLNTIRNEKITGGETGSQLSINL